jgi:hypothetical protein
LSLGLLPRFFSAEDRALATSDAPDLPLGIRRRQTGLMSDGPSRADDETYLRRLEALADRICQEALAEGWLMYLPDDDDQTPLQRAINELARNIRQVHYEGDGCVDGDHSTSA